MPRDGSPAVDVAGSTVSCAMVLPQIDAPLLQASGCCGGSLVIDQLPPTVPLHVASTLRPEQMADGELAVSSLPSMRLL